VAVAHFGEGHIHCPIALGRVDVRAPLLALGQRLTHASDGLGLGSATLLSVGHLDITLGLLVIGEDGDGKELVGGGGHGVRPFSQLLTCTL